MSRVHESLTDAKNGLLLLGFSNEPLVLEIPVSIMSPIKDSLYQTLQPDPYRHITVAKQGDGVYKLKIPHGRDIDISIYLQHCSVT